MDLAIRGSHYRPTFCGRNWLAIWSKIPQTLFIDIEAQTALGKTALGLAVACLHFEVVESLRENGAIPQYSHEGFDPFCSP